MNVLLVDQITSVTWKYSFSLADALKNQGLNVSVVTDLDVDEKYCDCETIKVFNTDKKGISKISKLFNYISGYKTILKLIKAKKIDIVHLEWLTFSPLDFYFIKKIKKRCKVVMTIHDIIAFDAHFYDKLFYKKVYDLPSALFIQTEDNIEKFKKLYPKINPLKIHLAFHGNFLKFADIQDQKSSRKALNVPENAFIFLFFGQIKKIKGVDLLIKAFAKVCEKHDDVHLIIAGNVWHNDFKPYQELIKSYGLQNKVTTRIEFIPDKDVNLYFSACDVVCLPYTELYQSGVVQLSYAYKKPAIVSNLPGFTMIVKDKINGYVFESGHIDDLVTKMENAIFSYYELPDMGQQGYNFIANQFSWNDIAQMIFKIYASL